MIGSKKVAVLMIVKNESAVITRALNSVAAVADLIVISDTGSTDNTLELIRGWGANNMIPVSLSEDAWHNFAFNRNVVLNNFYTAVTDTRDWLALSLDADDVFVMGTEDLSLSNPWANAISVSYKLGELEYQRVSIIADTKNWKWEAPVHEYLSYTGDKTTLVHGSLVNGYVQASSSEGARSQDPYKYAKDADVLAEIVDNDPSDTRSTFYLARSVHDHFKPSGDPDFLTAAIAAYRLRVTMTTTDTETFPEEKWYAQYMVASLTNDLQGMIDVCGLRPWRVEAALECSRIAELKGDKGTAFTYALLATVTKRPKPTDILFVDTSVYGWRALERLGVIAYYIEMYQVGLAALDECLDMYIADIPETDLRRIEKNRRYYLDKL